MTDQEPRISIVTPSFNQASFLRDAIESVLSQRYPNLEYFVLDGGSNDDSAEIIREYAEELTYWRSDPDDGQAAALVEGFGRSTGEILAWVNSDDMLVPGSLDAVANAWRTHGGEVIVAGGCEYIRGTAPSEVHFPTFQPGFDTPVVLPHAQLFDVARGWTSGAFFCQPEVFFPATAYRRVGGLNPSLFYTMDYDLWAKFAMAGVPVIVLDRVLARFREHPAQKTTDRSDRYRELVAIANGYVANDSNDLSSLGRSLLRATNRMAGYALVRSFGTAVRRTAQRLYE